MRGRNSKVMTVLTAAAMAIVACGGGGDDANVDVGEDEAPAAAPQPGPTPAGPAVTLGEGVTQAQFDQGQQLFTGAGGCHACHGPEATGTQLAPNLTDDEWINISGPNVQEIVDLINTGVPQPVEHPAPMPPMGGASLTADQVQALAGYVASIGGQG